MFKDTSFWICFSTSSILEQCFVFLNDKFLKSICSITIFVISIIYYYFLIIIIVNIFLFIVMHPWSFYEMGAEEVLNYYYY